MKRLLLALIQFYHQAVSPYLGRHCRFAPSCSAYAYESIERQGIWSGVLLSVRRVLKCHPFHPGGFDPVE